MDMYFKAFSLPPPLQIKTTDFRMVNYQNIKFPTNLQNLKPATDFKNLKSATDFQTLKPATDLSKPET